MSENSPQVVTSPGIDGLVQVLVISSTQNIKQEDVAFGGLKQDEGKSDVKYRHRGESLHLNRKMNCVCAIKGDYRWKTYGLKV